MANESKQSNQIEDENDKKSLDLTIAKKNDEICFKQEIKDIFVEPEAPKTIKKRKSDIKTEETQPSIDEIPSKKIAKIEPAENLCNDSEYLKKIEEQKRRRDEFLKEKEKKRKESKKIQISIEKETKTEAKVIKDDKKDKLNALLDTYLEEINKNEIKDLPKTFSKHIDKKYQPKTQQLKPLTYYEKLTPTNSSIYQPINIPQSAPIYEQVPLIYAPQTSLSPNTFIINPTLNIVPSIMMPPLLSNPPEPRFNFSQSLNKIPMIERNQIIRNLRPNIPQAFNSNNGSPGIGIHNIIQIKPIEIYPKAILYNLSLSTTEKRLVDLCNSINLKEKVKFSLL